jgi:hypothetical protein
LVSSFDHDEWLIFKALFFYFFIFWLTNPALIHHPTRNKGVAIFYSANAEQPLRLSFVTSSTFWQFLSLQTQVLSLFCFLSYFFQIPTHIRNKGGFANPWWLRPSHHSQAE